MTTDNQCKQCKQPSQNPSKNAYYFWTCIYTLYTNNKPAWRPNL